MRGGAPKLLISPLVEMSGRTEGGAKDGQRMDQQA
ncbi:hypothetical protein X773_30390 [Mesorhizobium sp. LSJC285A00]|nr:hypothetical protein X773_30390 [Mesorhizobium sp. LSJC285A00]ESW91104.1 hypothetical protein X770_10210 [Mesorhizobium sp. LSJC269B00]ESW95254.1 hypothetical protein X768_32845 [Mesorhizobium sp. LSJC265A00]